tara:strand:+ start:692 stop:958 length:267 start_codon:yes stop_codon:yes gene_type:complete
MKFEVKTENDEFSKSSLNVFFSFSIIAFIIILTNISIKLGAISRNYEITYLCKLILIEKTSVNLNKLSKLTNQTTKQKMWDLCREVVK